MNRCPRHPLVDHFLSPAVVTFLVRGISVLACGTRLTQATILLRLPRSGRMADYPRSEFLSRPVKEKAITSKDELRRYLEAWASSRSDNSDCQSGKVMAVQLIRLSSLQNSTVTNRSAASFSASIS